LEEEIENYKQNIRGLESDNKVTHKKNQDVMDKYALLDNLRTKTQ